MGQTWQRKLSLMTVVSSMLSWHVVNTLQGCVGWPARPLHSWPAGGHIHHFTWCPELSGPYKVNHKSKVLHDPPVIPLCSTRLPDHQMQRLRYFLWCTFRGNNDQQACSTMDVHRMTWLVVSPDHSWIFPICLIYMRCDARRLDWGDNFNARPDILSCHSEQGTNPSDLDVHSGKKM